MNTNKKYIAISIIFLFIAICIATAVGSSCIHPNIVVSILLHKILKVSMSDSISSNHISIIWILRFPRVLLAFFIGASLGISGCCIQSVLRNPLASPYTIGVSSGSSFAVAIAIMFNIYIAFLGRMTLPFIGLGSSLITIFIVINFSEKVDKYLSNQTIILVGIVFSLFINALLTIIIALSGEEMRQIIMWQMGSLSLRSWPYVITLLPFFILGFIGVVFHIKELDILFLGDEGAKSVGVDVIKVRKRLILFSSVLVGSAVAVSGTIGFIGLVTPHIVRRIFGPKHKVVIPMSMIYGGVFLIIADLIARTIISPAELPVGAITSLIGAPFFAFVYFSKRRKI
jgi:iron complex transport system permease protein